jgi:hypothetical protein
MGGSMSRTVTANKQEDVLPAASVAVQLTVVVPKGKAVPLAGWQDTATLGQLSEAATSKLTVAVH